MWTICSYKFSFFPLDPLPDLPTRIKNKIFSSFSLQQKNTRYSGDVGTFDIDSAEFDSYNKNIHIYPLSPVQYCA